MRQEYTIVRSTFSDTTGKAIKDRGYTCVPLYIDSNVISRQIRKFWLKHKLPFKSIWYDHKVLSAPDKILVIDALCTPDYLKWLKKKRSDAEINLWFWNIIKNSMNPEEIEDSWCQKWSFSRTDCVKYDMKFNPPPYFTEMIRESLPIEYDLSFVGKDKGRLEAILKYKQIFEDLGLNCKFIITPVSALDKNPNYSQPISYAEAIQISAQSKAVFDYIEVTDSGLSMRIMECLFQRKKVVTNGKLVRDYDFYDKRNIFVLGEDDIQKLPEFLNTPYYDVSDEIKQQYDFDRFVERFFDKTNPFDYMIQMMERNC